RRAEHPSLTGQPGCSKSNPSFNRKTPPSNIVRALSSSRSDEGKPPPPEKSPNLLTSAASIEARLHAVERIPSTGRGQPAQFVPIRFIYRNNLTKDDKLLLAFDALVFSEMLGRAVS